MAVAFYVVRHGETLLNCLNRAQGWSDSPLTDRGIETAAELGKQLRGTVFKAAYASDTVRATQTAAGILSASGNKAVSVQRDRRLREWCLGAMEGENNTVFVQTVSQWLGNVSSFAELNRRLPDVAAALYDHDTTGMAEPFQNILERFKSAFLEIAQDEHLDGCNVLVVTHAFAIKTLLYLFEPERLYSMDKVKNAAILMLVYDNGTFRFQYD